MTANKQEKDYLDDLLSLMDEIDKSDTEGNGMLKYNIVAPYSDGRKPEPVQWRRIGLDQKSNK